jgi:hypothetical protein
LETEALRNGWRTAVEELFRKVTAGDVSDVAYWNELEGQIPGCATAAARSRVFPIEVGDGTLTPFHLAQGYDFNTGYKP